VTEAKADDKMSSRPRSSRTRASKSVTALDLQSDRSGPAAGDHEAKKGDGVDCDAGWQVQRARPARKGGEGELVKPELICRRLR